MLLQIEQIGDLGATPSVDALVVIADDAKIAMALGESVHQFELSRVGVLIFIHHHVSIFSAARFEGLCMLAEQPQRQQN